jgi:tetratricopeptide (TPR) repeat protein
LNPKWIAIAGSLLIVLGCAIWWGLREPQAPPPSTGGAPVPMGKTVEQVLPGADGEPEVWTLRKREVDREDFADEALPSPSPIVEPQSEFDDSARALEARALESWKTGDIEGAMTFFQAAIKADPNDPASRLSYGRLLVLMTAYGEAWPQLERAAQLDPENPQVWVELMSFYERSQLLERAQYARERAEDAAGGREIVRDESGLWELEGNSVFP